MGGGGFTVTVQFHDIMLLALGEGVLMVVFWTTLLTCDMSDAIYVCANIVSVTYIPVCNKVYFVCLTVWLLVLCLVEVIPTGIILTKHATDSHLCMHPPIL